MRIFDKFFKRSKSVRSEPLTYVVCQDFGDSGYYPVEFERAIETIGSLLGSLTLQVWQTKAGGAKERLRNAKSYWLDIEPMPGMTRLEWTKKVVRTMYEKGVCFVSVESFGGNEQLKILEDFFVQSDGTVKSYKTNEVYKLEELLRFSVGTRPAAEALKQTNENLRMAAALKARFLKNSFMPSLVVKVDVDMSALTQENDQRLKNLQKVISRAVETGQPMIFEQGFVEIQELKGRTYEELGLNLALKDEQMKVAAFFGVPAFLVGAGNFNREEYNLFIKTTFMTIVRMFEQQLSRVFASDEIYVKYNTERLLSIDLREQMIFVSDCLGQGIITPNEARQKLGLTPSDSKGMDEFRILENYVPVAKLGDQAKLKQGEKDEQKKASDFKI